MQEELRLGQLERTERARQATLTYSFFLHFTFKGIQPRALRNRLLSFDFCRER